MAQINPICPLLFYCFLFLYSMYMKYNTETVGISKVRVYSLMNFQALGSLCFDSLSSEPGFLGLGELVLIGQIYI